MSFLFKNRSHPVELPPPVNLITGRPYGQPARGPDHAPDDALYAAGQLALASAQTPEDRADWIKSEAKAVADEERRREEAWLASGRGY